MSSEAVSSEKSISLPWTIQLYAAALIVFSMIGICNMIYTITFLDTLFLRIDCVAYSTLGWFLLQQSKRSRKIAYVVLLFTQFVLGASFVICIGLMCYFGTPKIPQNEYIKPDFFYHYGPWWGVVLAAIDIALIVFFFFVIKALRRPEVVELFAVNPKPKTTNHWPSILVVIGIIIGTGYCIIDNQGRQIIDHLRFYDAKIIPVDSKTQEPIADEGQSLSGFPPISSGETSPDISWGFQEEVLRSGLSDDTVCG